MTDQRSEAMTVAVLKGPLDPHAVWNRQDLLIAPELDNPPYRVGFISSDRALRAAQALRYKVFTEELGEGLPETRGTGLDQDRFDPVMTHLVLLHGDTNEVVGNYRLQSKKHAVASGMGFYASEQYELERLGAYLDEAVELGRACIHMDHRSFTAVMQLWKGIGVFMESHGLRYLFGCCSLTTQDPDDGWRALRTLRERSYIWDGDLIHTTQPYTCGDPAREFDPAVVGAYKIPKLFSAYMRLGARVVSYPAIDRDFGTVDFLILLDGHRVGMSALDVLT